MSYQSVSSSIPNTKRRLHVPENGTYIFTNGGEQEIMHLYVGDIVEFKLKGKATLVRLDSGYGVEAGSVEEPEEIRPSIEQCSVCAKKFELPKNLKGPQRLIPIHAELFATKCDGSGKVPK